MLIPGYKKYKEPTKSTGYNCENATFTKYGKEIKIHDFIQEGKDGTEASQIVKNMGGVKQLEHALEKIPNADFCVDLNIDAHTASKMIKTANVIKKELDRKAAIQKELEKLNTEQTQEKKGVENAE